MVNRELHEVDAAAAASLWHAVGLTRPWNPPELDFLRAVNSPNAAVLGSFDGAALVGTVMVGDDGHRGWIYYLAVEESHRRSGFGRDLMAAAEEWMLERNVVKVQLMVRSENTGVLGFYDRLGYDNNDVRVLSKWLTTDLVVGEHRNGSRPVVSTVGPQRQLSQKSSPEMWGRMLGEIFALDGVFESHSQVSPPSTRAVFLLDHQTAHVTGASLAPEGRLEPVHIHALDDTSIHLCLPQTRGDVLCALGWAEPHQYADFGTEFLVYGPRTMKELKVVLSIVEESIAFARSEPPSFASRRN